MSSHDSMLKAYGRFTVDCIQVPKMFNLAEFIAKEPELYEELCNDYPVEDINYFISVKEE